MCTVRVCECDDAISFFKHVMKKYDCSPMECEGGHFQRVKLTRIHQCVIAVLVYMYMYVHYAI